jgi:hypothetical protein
LHLTCPDGTTADEEKSRCYHDTIHSCTAGKGVFQVATTNCGTGGFTLSNSSVATPAVPWGLIKVGNQFCVSMLGIRGPLISMDSNGVLSGSSIVARYGFGIEKVGNQFRFRSAVPPQGALITKAGTSITGDSRSSMLGNAVMGLTRVSATEFMFTMPGSGDAASGELTHWEPFFDRFFDASCPVETPSVDNITGQCFLQK